MSQFTLSNSEIRSLITKWSDSVPHHNHRDLGDNITIDSVKTILAHQIIISSQTVSRHVTTATEPLNGQSYDNNSYIKANDIKCWNYQFTPPTTYTDQNSYFVIDASKHSTTCSSCSGKGTVRCLKCTTGKIACKTCGGTGKTKITNTTSCSSCNGSGSIRTYQQVCKIIGYDSNHAPIQRYENVQKSTRCSSCGGTGRKESVIYHTCHTCNGSGHIACPSCNGTTQVRCRTCIGKGTVLEYAKLHTQLATYRDETLICSDMTNGERKILLQEIPLSDYKRDKVAKSSNGRVTNVAFDTPLQNNTASTMLKKAAAAVPQNGRTLFEEAQLTTIELLVVYYTYDNINYRLYIANNQGRSIIANGSPIEGSYRELVAQAITSAKNKEFDHALATIKKCQDFPQSDKQDEDFEFSISIAMDAEISFGAKLGIYIFSLLFVPLILLYYIEYNYVLSYASFINNPDNYVYGFSWINAILTICSAFWLSHKIEDMRSLSFAKKLPSKALRLTTGALLSLSTILAATTIIATLNMIGIMPILCYALKLILTTAVSIIAFIVMLVVSLF